MKGLVIHPATERQLQVLSSNPGHAIILAGPSGSGKRSLAEALLATILGVESLSGHPYVMSIASPDGKAIGIESVRELEQFLSLKVPGKAVHDRAVLIQDAQLLSLEAQNALLKTLEEPPNGTVLVMTVNHAQALLPTIRSRSQLVQVGKPSKTDLEAYFSGNHPSIDKAYAISGGLPGLMHSLLEDEEHPLLQATVMARDILSKTTYERLLLVDELSKNKNLAQDTAFILQQMAHAGLQRGKGANKWPKVLTASYEAAEQLTGNAQSKLVLTKLMLSM